MPTPLERVDIDYEKLFSVMNEKGISKRKLSLDMVRIKKHGGLFEA